MTPFFRCAECGDHVKATEYGECAYCGGDVEIIDGEAQMIDIESMDRDALIAEIRRLRGESKGHRKCPCGGKPVNCWGRHESEMAHWIVCDKCIAQTGSYVCEDLAWAAWDGVE